MRARPSCLIAPPVSAFAQTWVAIFAITERQPRALNTKVYFDRRKTMNIFYIIGVVVVVIVVAGYLGVHL